MCTVFDWTPHFGEPGIRPYLPEWYHDIVIPIIPIFMIDLNQKLTIKKDQIDRKIGKKI